MKYSAKKNSSTLVKCAKWIPKCKRESKDLKVTEAVLNFKVT